MKIISSICVLTFSSFFSLAQTQMNHGNMNHMEMKPAPAKQTEKKAVPKKAPPKTIKTASQKETPQPPLQMNKAMHEGMDMNHMGHMTMPENAVIPPPAFKPTGPTVIYDLFVKDTTVNYTGRSSHALAINGQIPAPTLEMTEGDSAVFRVHNLLKEVTSIHWHGILIPNQFDGVPGLNNFFVKPGETFVVAFPVIQSGTYWYHSHAMTQEQIGLTGSIVIHKQNEARGKQQVLVLNDWTDTKPSEVWRQLKRQGDWYPILKKSVQSYGEAIRKHQLGDKLMQEWMRMPAMDISDVKYNSFLFNGKSKLDLSQYRAGDEVMLRVINASASSYFWLQFSGGKMKVIAADGQDVESVEVDKFLIATAETYDVMIKIPADGKYELRATAQDVSGTASAYFGRGDTIAAPVIPRVNYFEIMHHMNQMMMGMNMTMGAAKGPMTNVEIGASGKPENDMQQMDMEGMKMDKGGDMKMDGMNHQKEDGMQMDDMKHDTKSMHHGMKGMDGMDDMSMHMMMNKPMYGFSFPPANGDDKVLSYDMLKAKNNSTVPVPEGKIDRIITLTATGNMFRYVWGFNNKVLTEDDKILIKKGEHVRVIFKNNTMMEHPLHLHGHFFRLMNGQAFNEAPLKHTFNLLPMHTDTIDFAADEQKDWFFHCHTLYHMLSGMARVFHYDNTLPEVQRKSPATYRRFLKEHGRGAFLWGNAMLQSQGMFGNATLAGTRWEINEEWNWNWKKQYESETMVRKFLDKRQFLAVFVGADLRREKEKAKDGKPEQLEYRNRATLGLTYFLPLFIMAEGRVDHKGRFRLQVSRQDLAVTRRMRMNFSVNTDKEYMIGASYRLFRNLAVGGNYDSDYGWGAGLNFIY